MRRKDINMLSGSIVKGLLALSVPIMVMNVMQSLFNIIDMTILKTYDAESGAAVGAVGVCSTLISLITGLVIGISTGANVTIAKHIGRQDRQQVEQAVGTSVAVSAASGVLIGVIGIAFAKTFLRWTNCPEELLSDAVLYFRLYFAGVPLLMIYNFAAAILRSAGNSRQPMAFLIVGGVVKIPLTFLLVAVFRMGVRGVAIASVVSWAISAGISLLALARTDSIIKLRFRSVRLYKRALTSILRIGVPSGLQIALYSVANVIISAAVNSFGAAAATGISIANNYDLILYYISTATSLAVMPYVSQNIGSGNVKRAVSSVWKGVAITVCFGGFFGALSALFSRELSSIMSSDPAVIDYSRQKMIIISSTYFICGINEIFGAALRGMGKPMAATVTTLIFMCAFRFLWVYMIFPLLPNLTFLYLVWPTGWILSIITLLFVFFPAVKKLSRTADNPLV